jgi:hypothetical protein
MFEGIKAKVAAVRTHFNTASGYTRAAFTVAKNNAPVAIGAAAGLGSMFLLGEGLVASLVIGGAAGWMSTASGRDWARFGYNETKAQLQNAMKNQKRLPPPKR